VDDQWWTGDPPPPRRRRSRHRGGPPAAGLLDGLRLERPPDPPLPRRGRMIVAAIVVVPILAALTVVALIPWGASGRSDRGVTTAAGATRSLAAASARATPSVTAQPNPSATQAGGLREISPGDATGMLQQAGVTLSGAVQQAWTWTDSDGRNLLAAGSRAEFRGDAQAPRFTLEVAHLAGLDTQPRTLRIMHDPGLPEQCDGEGAQASAGFTAGSVAVTDLDGDGITEVSVGWTARCGGPDQPSMAKLALLTNGRKFILRGSGVLGAGGSMEPEPDAGDWPQAYLQQMTALFRHLYY
jgi:hypothetical protein